MGLEKFSSVKIFGYNDGNKDPQYKSFLDKIIYFYIIRHISLIRLSVYSLISEYYFVGLNTCYLVHFDKSI